MVVPASLDLSLIASPDRPHPPVLTGRSKLADGTELWRTPQPNRAVVEKFV